MQTLGLRGCKSLTSGYNEAIRRSPSKYKVFLHEDVFIAHPDFLLRALSLFAQFPDLGLLGVAGSETLPASGVWWESPRKAGKVLALWPGPELLDFGGAEEGFSTVVAVDGLLMMTQYDLEWDERLNGFHFYDTSQSLRFWQHGYKVGVLWSPGEAMVIHASGNDFQPGPYYKARDLFLHLYAEPVRNFLQGPPAAPADPS